MVDTDFDESEVAQAELEDLNFAQNLRDEIDASLETAADIIRRWLISFTPVRTGLTAASWEVVAVDRDEYYVTNSNEPVITYLTEGTAAHWVFPVNAEALHWVDEMGVDHFSRGHEVLGIEPTPIEEDALDEADPELEQLFDAAVEAAVAESYEA